MFGGLFNSNNARLTLIYDTLTSCEWTLIKRSAPTLDYVPLGRAYLIINSEFPRAVSVMACRSNRKFGMLCVRLPKKSVDGTSTDDPAVNCNWMFHDFSSQLRMTSKCHQTFNWLYWATVRLYNTIRRDGTPPSYWEEPDDTFIPYLQLRKPIEKFTDNV